MTLKFSRLFLIVCCFLSCVLVDAQSTSSAKTIAPKLDFETVRVAKALAVASQTSSMYHLGFEFGAKFMADPLIHENPDKQKEIDQIIADYYWPVYEQHIGELTDRAALIYAKNYSIGEMRAITKFYNSSVGKKFAERSNRVAIEMQKDMQKMTNDLVSEASHRVKVQSQVVNLKMPAMGALLIEDPKK